MIFPRASTKKTGRDVSRIHRVNITEYISVFVLINRKLALYGHVCPWCFLKIITVFFYSVSLSFIDIFLYLRILKVTILFVHFTVQQDSNDLFDIHDQVQGNQTRKQINPKDAGHDGSVLV